jgi:hypothetical protein
MKCSGKNISVYIYAALMTGADQAKKQNGVRNQGMSDY